MKSEVTKRLLVRLSLITNVFGALVATGNVNLPSSNHIRSTRDLLLAVISSSKRSRVLLPINSLLCHARWLQHFCAPPHQSPICES